ncbi:MAG: hypothetical protein AAFO91_06425, partial [Bacteroidota bacterium]
TAKTILAARVLIQYISAVDWLEPYVIADHQPTVDRTAEALGLTVRCADLERMVGSMFVSATLCELDAVLAGKLTPKVA